LLRHPRAQERAAMYLAYLARRDDYVGWQMDLENIDAADRRRYTQFVARVAARLHRESRLLSVAVAPRFSDGRSGELRAGGRSAAYDFRALGRVVDFMTLMTYDHHGNDTPPGPVAGYDWVKAALDYAARRAPRSKLVLGIPFYGREWVSTSQGTSSRSLTFQDVRGMLDRPETKAGWDEPSRTGWLEYRDGSGLHTAWYEDSRSLNEKLQLMQKDHLRGFAAWRLGVEDARFWSLAVLTPKSASPTSARRARTPRM
jgi:spore germination protein YaaH